MLDKRERAHWICEAADLSGYAGKRWAIMANSMNLYVDLVEALRQEAAGFGYLALPVQLRGGNEVCRLEGDAIILVIERVIEKDGVGYDTTVYCREQEMRPVIWKAVQPIVVKYGEKDFALLKSFLDTHSEDRHTPDHDITAGDDNYRHQIPTD